MKQMHTKSNGSRFTGLCALAIVAMAASGAIAQTKSAGAPATDAATVPTAARADVSLQNNVGPWGIASGAEWSGDFPKFNPLLKDAGVTWLRFFPEWQSIQPSRGEWNWGWPDTLVVNARENGIQVTGCFGYFAPWASADRGTRRGPIKDMQYWRDYVKAVTARYRNDIQHWEIWNEFNESFYQGINKPKEYADLTVAAYEEAKKVNPKAMIGLSVANFDVGFLDETIKLGAANHFDFVCVHPYENAGSLMTGGESGYLSLAGSLRSMLKANKQKEDMPLWITEIGYQTTVAPNASRDATQAEDLAKVYVLSIAQGFERVCWFEARGPAYGHGTDYGIIRKDWTLRPVYTALQTLTRVMGGNPAYVGWLEVGDKGYGFVFENAGKFVLATWMPLGVTTDLKFDSAVNLVDLSGKTTALAAGASFKLGRMPVLVKDVPAALVAKARAQKALPFPWGDDYSKKSVASCKLGDVNQELGVKQTHLHTTAVVNSLTETWRRTNFAAGGEGRYIYFRTDPTFVGFGQKKLEITVVAKLASPDKGASMGLTYESMKGYRAANGRFGIPAGEGWHEYTWKVEDANFVGAWGWNFRTDSNGSPNECHVKEVRVKRLD